MAKQILIRAFVGSLVCVASSAFSQTSSASKPLDLQWQPYVQGAVGSQRLESPSLTGTGLDLNGTHTRTAFRATVGWQLSPHWGVEGTWFQLPNATVRSSTAEATYHGSAVAASLAGSFPLNDKVQAVGRVGVGRSDMKVDAPSAPYSSDSTKNLTVWGWGLRIGIQANVDLVFDHDNLGTVGKYQAGDSVKASMYSLGLRFKF